MRTVMYVASTTPPSNMELHSDTTFLPPRYTVSLRDKTDTDLEVGCLVSH